MHDPTIGTTSFPRPFPPGQNSPVGLAKSASDPTNDNLTFALLGPQHTRLLAHTSPTNNFQHPTHQTAIAAATYQHSLDSTALYGMQATKNGGAPPTIATRAPAPTGPPSTPPPPHTHITPPHT